MSNMIQAIVEIQGKRPLLFNKFGPDCIPLTKKERTGVAGNDPDEWKRRICWTDDKQLYLEPSAMFACLRDGAKYTKKARGSLQPDVVATLQVCEDRILLDRFLPAGELGRDPSEPVYCHVCGVKIKASGSWNVRYRLATSKGWSVVFRLIWDKTIVNRTQMNAVCIDAGRYVGIGDGRKIGFGRFEVLKFEVEDAQDAAAA